MPRERELRLEMLRTSPAAGTRACVLTRGYAHLCVPGWPGQRGHSPIYRPEGAPGVPGCLFQVCVRALTLWGPSRPAAQDLPFLFYRLRSLGWMIALNLKSLSMESKSSPRYLWSHRGGGGSGRLTPFNRASLSCLSVLDLLCGFV